MPTIALARRWQTQPKTRTRINLGHPLAWGFENQAAFFYIFNEVGVPTGINPFGTDTVYDFANNNNGNFGGSDTSGLNLQPTSPSGLGVVFTAAKSQHVNSNVLIDARINPQGTVYWGQQPTTAYNTGAIRAMWGAMSTGVVPEFTAQAFLDNNLYIGWNKVGTDSRVSIANSPAYWTAGRLDHWALTWINGSKSQLFVNGNLIGTAATNSSVNAFSGSDTFYIGRQGNGTQYFDGRIPYFAITGRCHDQGRIQAFAQNSYQILQPLSRRVYVLPATVAAATIQQRRTLGQRVSSRQYN